MEITQLIQNAYNSGAQGYHAYWPRRHEFIEPERKEFMARLPENARILDVGCGPGQDSEYFSNLGFKVTGIDLSDKFIEIAKKRVPNAAFQKADMRKLDFLPEYFDGIWASFSFLHIPFPDAQKTLAGLLEILKPGGQIFFAIHTSDTTHDRTAPIAGLKDHEEQQVSTFVQEWSQEDFKKLLTDAGLEIKIFRPFDRPGGSYPLLSTLSVKP